MKRTRHGDDSTHKKSKRSPVSSSPVLELLQDVAMVTSDSWHASVLLHGDQREPDSEHVVSALHVPRERHCRTNNTEKSNLYSVDQTEKMIVEAKPVVDG